MQLTQTLLFEVHYMRLGGLCGLCLRAGVAQKDNPPQRAENLRTVKFRAERGLEPLHRRALVAWVGCRGMCEGRPSLASSLAHVCLPIVPSCNSLPSRTDTPRHRLRRPGVAE